jgi:hypothetical protein
MLIKFLALTKQKSKQITILLIILLFIISTGISISSGNELRYPDEYDYHTLAKNVLFGKGFVNDKFEPTAFRPPGYPFIISIVYRIYPHPLSVKLLNTIAYSFTALLISFLVIKINPDSQIFAPLLFLFYPVGLYAVSTLYPQTLGSFFLAVIIIILYNYNHTIISICISGILFGILILLIPSFLLITPIIFLIINYTGKKKSVLSIKYSAVFSICVFLVLLPWTIRNYQVFGDFIPISTNSGLNLLLGNSENTHPNSGVNVDISTYTKEVIQNNEALADKQLTKFAIDWIKNNPKQAASLYFQKVINFFNFRNELYVQSEGSRLKDLLVFITYYPLLIIAVIRIIVHKYYPLKTKETFLYVLYFGNAFLSAIYFTRIRFRIPFDILLIAINAIFLGVILNKIIAHSKKNETS